MLGHLAKEQQSLKSLSFELCQKADGPRESERERIMTSKRGAQSFLKPGHWGEECE